MSKLVKKTVPIQCERNMFARCLIISKHRGDVDIKESLGQHEFHPYPRSLFGNSGELLSMTDKSKLMHELINYVCENESGIHNQRGESHSECLVLDGMGFVREIGKPVWVKTCADLALHFCNQLISIGSQYREVHVIFDRYDIPSSLKQATHDRRTGHPGKVRYLANDKTTLANITLKKFLSHSSTKDSLTKYLAQKIADATRDIPRTFIVSYSDRVLSNDPRVDTETLCSTQEEADTKIILHSINAAQRMSSLDVRSNDTDVLVLLTRRFPMLPERTSMIIKNGTSKKRISIKEIYNVIGSNTAEALPGFHAFTGSDQTGRFAGIGKGKARLGKFYNQSQRKPKKHLHPLVLHQTCRKR